MYRHFLYEVRIVQFPFHTDLPDAVIEHVVVSPSMESDAIAPPDVSVWVAGLPSATFETANIVYFALEEITMF
ncbi:hypothetical protein DPMN_032116 [Dreissena polymorpha]|uniref:Uncharacterized protein n=1 Tax=Dreissena polymorpha TaxID=45954 RepID=A0A9D4M5Y2_DREPO|nr:hypothetical protein DPMN_032116 [Dreissena polymorpha]